MHHLNFQRFIYPTYHSHFLRPATAPSLVFPRNHHLPQPLQQRYRLDYSPDQLPLPAPLRPPSSLPCGTATVLLQLMSATAALHGAIAPRFDITIIGLATRLPSLTAIKSSRWRIKKSRIARGNSALVCRQASNATQKCLRAQNAGGSWRIQRAVSE